MASKRYVARGKLGTGSRFKRLRKTLAGREGVTDPDALTAWIGRKVHGKKKMAGWAAKGRKRK